MERETNEYRPAMLTEEQLQKLESLEEELGYTLVAYEERKNVKNNK